MTTLTIKQYCRWFSCFFQSSQQFRYFFVMNSTSSSNVVFISSIIANFHPFIDLCCFINRKKSHGIKSGEYNGWGTIAMLLLVKKSCVNKNVWLNALSWCNTDLWKNNYFVTDPGLPLDWIGFGLDVITIYIYLVTNYDLFE